MLRPSKLILENHLAPGDILMLTAALRDLHLGHPGRFVTDVRTPCPGFMGFTRATHRLSPLLPFTH